MIIEESEYRYSSLIATSISTAPLHHTHRTPAYYNGLLMWLTEKWCHISSVVDGMTNLPVWRLGSKDSSGEWGALCILEGAVTDQAIPELPVYTYLYQQIQALTTWSHSSPPVPAIRPNVPPGLSTKEDTDGGNEISFFKLVQKGSV